MNYAIEDARKLLEEVSGIKVGPEDIKVSQVSDISSTIAFRLAKESKKNPEDIAEDLVGKIKPRGFIESVEAVNGYINFQLKYENFSKHVLESILNSVEDYGKPLVSPKEKIVLEHTSVNPSGPIHVGRLRNSIIGDSIKRILSFTGYDVETRYWVNDIGKQIGIIAAILNKSFSFDNEDYKRYEQELGLELKDKYKRYENKDDFWIFFEYVIGNRIFEEDKSFQGEVQKLIRDAESGDKKALENMKKAASTCLKGQLETFNRLGINFNFFDYESMLLTSKEIPEIIKTLKKHRLWVEKDIGSGLDLSGFGLEKRAGATIMLREDGTTVYITRDLAYHLMKMKRGDRLINVLGEDHKFEFQELKTILTEIFKVKKPIDVVHYSFVSFGGTKLSTRKGETAPVDQLIDEAIEKAKSEIEKRGIAGKETAKVIGIGAVKYHIIKTAPSKPITFSWEEALSFDGEASPYIQYVHARSCRILEKSGEDVGKINVEKIDLNLEDIEKQLLKEISLFPDVIERSAIELKPNLIANYLYSLASTYNKFYIKCPVLPAEKEVRERRLLIVYSVKQIIGTGLSLLGIEAPDKM